MDLCVLSSCDFGALTSLVESVCTISFVTWVYTLNQVIIVILSIQQLNIDMFRQCCHSNCCLYHTLASHITPGTMVLKHVDTTTHVYPSGTGMFSALYYVHEIYKSHTHKRYLMNILCLLPIYQLVTLRSLLAELP